MRVDSAILPLWIGVDGLALRFRNANLPRRMGCPTSNRDRTSHKRLNPSISLGREFPNAIRNSAHPYRICLLRSNTSSVGIETASYGTSRSGHDTVFHALHSPKAPANHAFDRVDLQFIFKKQQLKTNRISHGDIREVDPINRLVMLILRNFGRNVPMTFGIVLVVPGSQTFRTCTAVAASENVTANDEVLIGIECFSRSEQIAPPCFQAGISREGVANDDDVVTGSIESSVGVVFDEGWIENTPG
mmetsp:Transcript_20186/g.40532  ORF Transcript_20186/g.40532 Transcript_20186/m.40532 type:complete len:246 (+) Transcript_20186:644-1381(+)